MSAFKSVFIALILSFAVALTGCGVKRSEYDKVVVERDLLAQKVESMKSQNADLQKRHNDLELAMTEAQRRISELTDANTKLKGDYAALEAKMKGMGIAPS